MKDELFMSRKNNAGTIGNIRRSRWFKHICLVLLHCFTINILLSDLAPTASAGQSMMVNPGTLLAPSASVQYPVLRAIRVYPQDPFEIDFMIDPGDRITVGQPDADPLIKYFLTALTVPVDDLWVNLSPYEPTRIIPDQLVKTQLGRELLMQDYLLKQLSASMTYPETKLGQKFWSRVYKKIEEKYGLTDIPINTFSRVWIVPEKAVVYEKDNMAFISESRLDVMLEQDYLTQSRFIHDQKKLGPGLSPYNPQDPSNQIAAQIVKEIILPELKKEVNEGEHFASLRQVFNSLILALWYKSHLKRSLITKIYGDQNKISGVDTGRAEIKDEVYRQYIQALKVGVYNYIKEDYDGKSQTVIPRKYFSGGFSFKNPDRWLSFRPLSQYGGSIVDLLGKLKQKLVLSKVRLKPIGVSVNDLIRSYGPAIDLKPASPSGRTLPGFTIFLKRTIAKLKKPSITGMLVLLTLGNLAVISQANAATFTNDPQGNMVIQVEQGDTLGDILKDIRRSYRKHDQANYKQSQFSKSFWGKGGSVDHLANTIIPNPANPNLILENQSFTLTRGVLPELVQERLTKQPLPVIGSSSGGTVEPAQGAQSTGSESQRQGTPDTNNPSGQPQQSPGTIGPAGPEVQKPAPQISVDNAPSADQPAVKPKEGFFNEFFEIIFSVLAMVSFVFVFFQNRKGKERSETSKESFLRIISDYLKRGQKNQFTIIPKEAVISKRAEFDQISAVIKGDEIILTLRAKNALNGRNHSRFDTINAIMAAFNSNDIRFLANRGKPTELKLTEVEIKTTSIKFHLKLSRNNWKKGIRFKPEDPLGISYRVRGENFESFEIPLVEEKMQEFLDPLRATLAAEKLYERREELESDRKKADQQKDLSKKKIEELQSQRKILVSQEKLGSLKVALMDNQLKSAYREHEFAKDRLKRLNEIMSLQQWVLTMRRFRENNPVIFKDVRGRSVETNYYLQELSFGMLERLNNENGLSGVFKQYFRETSLHHSVIARLKGHAATLDTNQSLFLPVRDDLSFRLFHYPLDKWSRIISLSEFAYGRAKRKAMAAIVDYYNSRRRLDRLEKDILGGTDFVAGKTYTLENIQRDFLVFTDGLEKPFPDSITGHDIWRRRTYVVSVLLVLWNLGFLIKLFIPFLLAVGSFGLTRLMVPNSYIFTTEREFQNKLARLKSIDPLAEFTDIKAELSPVSLKGEFLNGFSRHFMPKPKGWSVGFRLKSERFYDIKTVRVNGSVEMRIMAESFFAKNSIMLNNIQAAFMDHDSGNVSRAGDPILKIFLIQEGQKAYVEPSRVSVNHHPTGIRISVKDVPANAGAVGIEFRQEDRNVISIETPVTKDAFIDLLNEWQQFNENPYRLDPEPVNHMILMIQQFMDTSELKINDFKKNSGYYNEIREHALDSYMILSRANSPDLQKYQEYFLTLAQYANQVRLLMASFTGLYVLKSQFQPAKSRFLWKPFGITLAAKLRDFFGVTALYEWSSNDVLVTIDEISDTLKELEIAQAKIIGSSQTPIYRAALYERKLKNLRDEHDSIDHSYQYLPQHSLATGSDLHQRNFNMAVKFVYTLLFFISSVFVIVPTLDLVLETLGLLNFPDITVTKIFTNPEFFGLSLASLSIVYFIVISRILPYLAYMEPDEEFSFFENTIERFRNEINMSEQERNDLDKKMKNYLTKNRKMFSIPILLAGLLVPVTIPAIFLSLEAKFALRKKNRERSNKRLQEESTNSSRFHDKVSSRSKRLISPLSQVIYKGPQVTITYEGQRQYYSDNNKKPSVTYMKVYDAKLSPEGESVFREAVNASDGQFILASDDEILNGRFETIVGGEPVVAVITRNVPPVLNQFDQLGLAERYRLFSEMPMKTVYDERGNALEKFEEVRVTVKSRVRLSIDGKLLLMQKGPVNTGEPVQFNTIGGGLELDAQDRQKLEGLGAHDFEVDQHDEGVLDWRFAIPVKNLEALEKLINEQQPHLAHFGRELIEELTIEKDLLTRDKFNFVFGDMAVLTNAKTDTIPLLYSDFEKETSGLPSAARTEGHTVGGQNKGGVDLKDTEGKMQLINGDTPGGPLLNSPAVPLVNFQGMDFVIIQLTPMFNPILFLTDTADIELTASRQGVAVAQEYEDPIVPFYAAT